MNNIINHDGTNICQPITTQYSMLSEQSHIASVNPNPRTRPIQQEAATSNTHDQNQRNDRMQIMTQLTQVEDQHSTSCGGGGTVRRHYHRVLERKIYVRVIYLITIPSIKWLFSNAQTGIHVMNVHFN